MSLPIIDMAPLFGAEASARAEVAKAIAAACEDDGFFYVVGHGVTSATLQRLEAEARAFFDLPLPEKEAIAMANGGPAWRGWFPLRGELTSGVPDNKEGLYLGEELPADDPRVAAGWPLHGANLWPAGAPGLRPAVATFMAEARAAAAALVEGVSLALGLDDRYFARHYLERPTLLFRIFRYPPTPPEAWGVAEHTDYGLLTLLAQDDAGGLEVRTRAGWRTAPPIPGALVCNIGDMLERLTGGRFVSTPHRVVNRTDRTRFSFPFFYDPDFAARMIPPPGVRTRAAAVERWDNADVHAVEGTYGEYLMAKVGRVFPELGSTFLPA
ncbi:MAG TPA: 2-oxoglutarate and iron-dependent oxygenase domain-containing protein [Caulobacteraceae bacterium]|nr:2-oxoglutarate and iron-dependent oxygenase domain-containing protein [Caulobacteraceae bacterium]